MITIVKTQTKLDAAIKAGKTDIIIDSPAGVWIELRDSSSVEARGSSSVEAQGSSSVEARGSSSVVARGSSSVVARGSSSVVAWDSSSVVARDSSRVEARGSSSVVARGSSRVEARGSSSVEARGSSSVVAWDSSRVEAGKCVAVHLHSQHVTLTGGVVIDMTKVNATVLADWSDLTGVQPDTDGFLTVYKAVNDDLRSGYDFHYPIGETVTDLKWRDDHECGGGLHFSPTPAAAKEYFPSATRFLECRVAVADVRCIDSSKLKARSVTVVQEVDLWTREPIEVAS